MCEHVQRGLQGGLYRPGRYHSQEAPCHAFANYVLDKVVGRPV